MFCYWQSQKEDKMMHVKNGNETIALLPADFIARGPLVDRKKSKPNIFQIYLSAPKLQNNLSAGVLLKLLSSPNIASKHWVYRQYDHEVGIRTVS